MPDSVVDRSGADPQDLSPAQTDSTPSKNGEDSSRRNVGAERRIAELVKQKHEIDQAWQRKYEDLSGRFDALEARVSQVGQNGDQKKSAPSPIFTSYETLPQDDLEKIILMGPSENPGVYAAAQKEDRRRALTEMEQRLRQSNEAQYKASQLNTKAWDDVKKRYGAEIDDPQSSLRQRAEQYMAQMKREHGPNVVQDMNAQRLCVSLAHHDLHAQDPDELAAARRELERAKQSQALESGVRGAAKLTDEVESRLKKRDIKGAVGKLAREMLQDQR